jgi:hypothetical protein
MEKISKYRVILGLFEARCTKNPNFLSKLGLKSWKIGRLDNFLIRKFSQKFTNFRKLSQIFANFRKFSQIFANFRKLSQKLRKN